MTTEGNGKDKAISLPQLAPAELLIMKALWGAGPLSGREIHDRVVGRTGWAYSTTRTTIERLVRKRMLTKRTFHGLHVFAPAISRAQGVARLVRDFALQVLDLPNVPVAALFSESTALTPSEIEDVRTLLRREMRSGKGRT